MIKIPGLDDLKKIGSDLMESAKTVDLSGVVNKVKSGIDSVSKKSNPQNPVGDDPLGVLLQEVSAALNELSVANNTQAAAIKKMQNQLADIVRVAGTYQKPIPPPVQKPEDNQTL